MERVFFIIVAALFFSFNSTAQTKRDGTPDMRYNSNKKTYSAPQEKSSNYSGSRPVYGGETHTSSHGGKYVGQQNSQSHKGGTYSNPKSNNNYGIHKKK
jgi:hypothetical protein